VSPPPRPAALPLLLFLAAAAFFADLWFGSVPLAAVDVWQALTGGEVEDRVRLLVIESRLPRALTAALAGASLAVSGLLMQTFFRNPAAGPYLLGVSAGASLGVALVVLSAGGGLVSGALAGGLPLRVLAAGLGACAMLGVMAVLALRVRDLATLLVIGLMLASFLSAVVGVLQYFAAPDALRDFVYWTFGSLDHTRGPALGWLAGASVLGIGLAAVLGPSLDVLGLGEDYARSMGVAIVPLRLVVVGVTALLAGTVTAFCGPVAFIGIAVPHAARGLLGPASHRWLVPASALAGAGLLVACDLVSRLPGLQATLPVNAVTSLMGAPAVVAIVWRQRRLMAFS
jgi:iron complex transport system permease protein